MNPKIMSIGYALPKYCISQADAFDMLEYPHHFRTLFLDSGIDQRYFTLPLDVAKSLSWQQQQECYAEEALTLSANAIQQAMDERDFSHIGCVIYDSCTGFAPGPTMAHRLAKIFPFPKDTYFTNISSHGCESGFPGLKRAVDYVFNSSEKYLNLLLDYGRQALVVNCELSSLAYFPEPKLDPTNDYELLRANVIFADAAAAVLVGAGDDDWRHPVILGTETSINTDYIDDLGFIWQDGRLRVRLSKRVAEVAARVVEPSLIKLLGRFGLTISQVRWWVVHAAGSKVMDRIHDQLGVPEEKLALSRETLREFGNTSSTSVGITGKRLMAQDIRPGDYVIMLSVGPGMSGGATLLQFER